MKIKNEILKMVRKNTKTRREIARSLDLSDGSMTRILNENKINGPLTKVICLKIISINHGVPENLILE